MLNSLTSSKDEPTPEVLHQTLKTMELIHGCDQRATADVQKGQLRAAYYPVRGLEAVCAALGQVARHSDALVSTYRNMGDVIAKGANLRSVIAEVYGRSSGTSKGKGGPMHLADVSAGLMATSGIVGGGLPIAAGLALAKKLDGGQDICFTTFGDGATSIGAFHEALNLATLWQLPLVLICQNNQWGEHTAYKDYAPVGSVCDRAAAYGIRAARINGFDAVACWQALKAATDLARDQGGPTLLEFVTYRLMPHSAAGDASYVPKNELVEALKREPLPQFRQWLLDHDHLTQEDLDEIQAEAGALVEDAFAFARSSAPPASSELMADVYSPGLDGSLIA